MEASLDPMEIRGGVGVGKPHNLRSRNNRRYKIRVCTINDLPCRLKTCVHGVIGEDVVSYRRRRRNVGPDLAPVARSSCR